MGKKGINLSLSTRLKRKLRQRKKFSPLTPRVCVYKSSKHTYAQIISDENGSTLVSASSKDKELNTSSSTKSVDTAKEVGTLLAKRAVESGLSKVIFDRNGFVYHGRIKALADGAREGGLKF